MEYAMLEGCPSDYSKQELQDIIEKTKGLIEAKEKAFRHISFALETPGHPISWIDISPDPNPPYAWDNIAKEFIRRPLT